MPPVTGFSDNPFRQHEDFQEACITFLRKLKPYQSDGGARIRLPLVTGTHFDDVAAQLEGFARPLWAIGSLIHGGGLSQDDTKDLIEPYVRGLANGTNPDHPEYWGPVVLRDQRMVEMEIISFALLAAPDVMFHRQTKEAQKNIADWLGTINGKDFPTTNWLWFRVMTNLALVKVCGRPYEEAKEHMNEDLNQMENFFLSDGWAADGMWNDQGRQADYYSGSFAIQFSQLLYVKMAEDLDPERCAKFRARASDFAASFWRYFDPDGAAIPFGRSLTYRFAFAGFWAAAAFADVNLPEPVKDWGVVKGILLRHFRWWTDKNDMFNVDGTLTIGFTFPNMYMGEDYNSPQSPYWAMKSFVALGLPKTHPFWQSQEKALPSTSKDLATTLKSPLQIVCNTGNHHFLLSSGQFCPWPLKATEAKYGKFAYSSHFGFSVPTGQSWLAQIAPDSTIALRKNEDDPWRVPWKLQNIQFGTVSLVDASKSITETIPKLSSVWAPFKDAGIEVSTTLIAPSSRWPDWHIRIHSITNKSSKDSVEVEVAAGGFAIYGREAKMGDNLPLSDIQTLAKPISTSYPEGVLQERGSVLICSSVGASGIRLLDANCRPNTKELKDISEQALKPDANTNLMWQRTLIPITQANALLDYNSTLTMVVGVYALKRSTGQAAVYDRLDVSASWGDAPILIQDGQAFPSSGSYIRV
ncbi:hypothetical protein B0J11DRAFT_572323 [Dendryphion nanum]|uniref:DUF2264 domain-containing protein n=1 Tax=Dendryphion nanum TaxID=256645 RepID=A0A9P9D8D9_9PLEO|nr:hypothetical protein B0J11DRAFT_572323 [Dendryphion nanum]